MYYRSLIYINKKVRRWASIPLMLKAYAKGFDLVRMIVLAATLLLAPYTAFAGGLEHHASKPDNHSAASHQADAVIDSASGNHNTPAGAPLHCHEKSPTPQATALTLEPISPDLPLLIIEGTPPLFRPASTSLNSATAQILIAGPPRFILFSNFRS